MDKGTGILTEQEAPGKVGAAVVLRLLQLGYPVLAHSSDPERPRRWGGGVDVALWEGLWAQLPESSDLLSGAASQCDPEREPDKFLGP